MAGLQKSWAARFNEQAGVAARRFMRQARGPMGGLDKVIEDLFANNEVGVFYDPSDLPTMFQDSAGTTQVTADGQPVGLILDKSKGLVLGSEFIANAADREFSSDTGFWSKEGSATISGGVVNINNVTATSAIYRFNFPNEVSGYYEIAFDLVLTQGSVQVLFGNFSSETLSTSGRKTIRLYRSAVGTFAIRTVGATTALGTIDNLTIKRISGNHASQATAASRPLYKTDGTYHWLQFDGVDDSLSTAAINFTSTDKMFICAGSVSAPYVAQSVFLELGPTYDSTFPAFLIRGCHPATNYLFSAFQDSYAYYTAPYNPINLGNVKTVQTRQLNTAALYLGDKRHNDRVNAVEYAVSSSLPTSAGGNWINAPLNIGRRNNASSPFTGNIYSLIVRGALSTTQEITDTETWVNGKTGAF